MEISRTAMVRDFPEREKGLRQPYTLYQGNRTKEEEKVRMEQHQLLPFFAIINTIVEPIGRYQRANWPRDR
jgi:hypothetical protein